MHFLNENHWAPIQISLLLVPKSATDNISALRQANAWGPSMHHSLTWFVVDAGSVCVTMPSSNLLYSVIVYTDVTKLPSSNRHHHELIMCNFYTTGHDYRRE